MQTKKLSDRGLRLWVLICLFGLSTMGMGCLKKGYVRQVVPAKHSFGQAKRLVIVMTSGHHLFGGELMAELTTQSKSGRWWSLADVRGEKVDLRVLGRRVHIQPKREPRRDEVFLRLDLKRWMVERNVREKEVMEGESRRTERDVSYVSKATFRVTAVDADHRVLMDGKRYEGIALLKGANASRKAAKSMALRRAVEMFLNEITPSYYLDLVKIDTSQKDNQKAISLLKRGQFQAAARLLLIAHQGEPRRADILYNIGVALEGMKKYKAALGFYDKALQRDHDKPFYEVARGRCARRLQLARMR